MNVVYPCSCSLSKQQQELQWRVWVHWQSSKGRAMYVFIFWSQTPLHSSKTTASAKTMLEKQFIHKPSTSEKLPNVPHKVTMPARLYYCKTRDHREQKPEKLFHVLALRITICLTLCDGSQEALWKRKERRKGEEKGAKPDKPSQQHPPLLSRYPLRRWKHAAIQL